MIGQTVLSSININSHPIGRIFLGWIRGGFYPMVKVLKIMNV